MKPYADIYFTFDALPAKERRTVIRELLATEWHAIFRSHEIDAFYLKALVVHGNRAAKLLEALRSKGGAS